MSDIEHWLGTLSLEKYVSVFTEAEIDFPTLPHLTDEDLKELGLPLGPRRKVIEAIKQLQVGTSLPSAQLSVLLPEKTTTSTPDSPQPPSPAAERRHLTVMFVDLVGSTEMSNSIDVEDMREVITNYQNTVAKLITSHDGYVAKFMGDGVLCYFGWPRANEDDAERAVRAGLDIIACVKRLNGPKGVPLSTRVGVATGIVVVGDLIGSGASEEAAVVGETPNLAARLQGLAQPDQLVLPQQTRALLGNVFELQPIGAHDLKGIAQPVQAFVVTGESMRESRFDANQTGTITPIIGREQELGLMRECWTRVTSGSGHMIIVSGEAGIGKSRVTRAMIDEIAVDDHTRITCQCSPYHTDSAFHPIIAQMTFAAGFDAADDDDTRLDKLERLAGVDVNNVALLAAMLGIDAATRYGELKLTPALQRARTMQALSHMMVRLSQDKPLLFVFEDLHWIDPTSLELLDITLDAIVDEKILILTTARPTFEHGFGGHPSVTRFALNRLGRDQVDAIVERLTGGRSMPEEVLQIIASRTDGVPLFVEELAKTVLETGGLKAQGNRYVLDGPLDALAIPGTLHDSLMARLDRLQPLKTVAQAAACIGREFDYSLLVSISLLPERELNSALEGLIKAELVYRRGVPPEAQYLFKHALVRDAAYESLLRENRRSIHHRVLQSLEKTSNTTPEVLAWHAEAAGLTERAIDLWEAASEAAIARPAFDEAISHLGHAIALLSPQIDDGTQAVLEQALELQVQLATAQIYRRGYSADEAKDAFEYALLLADRVGETPLRVPVLNGLIAGKSVRSQYADALLLAEALLNLVESSTDTMPIATANRSIGHTLSYQGRFIEAQPPLVRAHALFDPELHGVLAQPVFHDPGVAASCFLALNLWFLGETRQAQTHILEAEQAAKTTDHSNTICFMHMHVSVFALLARDEAVLERHVKALAELSTEHKLEGWLDEANLIQALIVAGAGDAKGLEHFKAVDARNVASGLCQFVTYFRIEAGVRALALELVEQAQTLADMARTLIGETDEAFALAELHRLEGALALTAGIHNAAEVSLKAAVAVARKQGSKSWELRAAIDFARLLHSMGRTEEACTLLKPVHDSIEEGDCAEDCATAHAFLADHSM